MTRFAALVVTSRTKAFNDPQHDLVFVDADDKEDAIRFIQKHQFSYSWWRKGISKCAVIKLFPLNNLPPSSLVVAIRQNPSSRAEPPSEICASTPRRQRRQSRDLDVPFNDWVKGTTLKAREDLSEERTDGTEKLMKRKLRSRK